MGPRPPTTFPRFKVGIVNLLSKRINQFAINIDRKLRCGFGFIGNKQVAVLGDVEREHTGSGHSNAVDTARPLFSLHAAFTLSSLLSLRNPEFQPYSPAMKNGFRRSGFIPGQGFSGSADTVQEGIQLRGPFRVCGLPCGFVLVPGRFSSGAF